MANKKSLQGMKPFIVNQASAEVVDLATTYVNDYVNHIESVPFDLQKKVTRLREIDLACQDHVSKIEGLYESFTKKKEPAVKSLLLMQQLLALCKELGDEKITIVEEVNEIVESKNKILEVSKRQFLSAHDPDHKEILNGKREKDGKYDGGKSAKRPRRSNQNERIMNDRSSDNNIRAYSMYNPPSIMPNSRVALNEEKKKSVKATKEKKEDKKEKKEETRTAPKPDSASNSPSSSITPSISANSNISTKSSNNTSSRSAVKTKKKKKKVVRQSEPLSPLMDIPIDPDEPTYCLCNQVSFGQMIGCDNKKCHIEWFHFSCVGLTHKPKGNWYCYDCRQKKDRKKDKRDK